MNKVFKYMAAAIFIATLAINVVVTLDDPFVMLSDEAIATTSSSSSSSSSPNWAYVEKIVSTPVYGTTWELSTGISVIAYNLPIGFNGTYTVNTNGVVGHNKNCESPAIARCNQNDVGYYPI